MKKILYKLVLLVCLAPKTVNAQCGWNAATSPLTTDLRALHFPNQQNGWAVGVSGKVVHSTDGGQTWVEQNAQTVFMLNSVHFINNSTGWTVGNEGTVRMTTDGGMNWTAKNVGTNFDLYDVWFADASNGWISGACGLILRTTDGGANWTIINTGQTSNIYQVKVPNGTNGAAATSSTVLLNTSNGGTVWPSVAVTPRSFRALDIAANGRAFAAAANGPVMRSLDAGITWTPATRPPGRGAWQSLSIANSNAVYVAGLGGQVYKSSDSGNTWTDFSSGLGNTNIYGLQMASDSVGWAVGEGGKIFFLRIPPRPLSISGNFDFCDSTRLTAIGGHTQWAWSNGRNNSAISVTTSGTYTVTATSAEGCTSTASIAVTRRPSLTSLMIDNVGRPTCAGQATGRATAIASGGIGTVTFLWSNNTVGATINNVPIGTYTVTATNGNGCTSTASVEIKSNNPPANVVITPTAAACGQSNGRIDLTVPPTASYSYRWNTNATSKNLSNIPGGTYTVTVTDLSIGCTSVFTTVVGGTIPTISGIATTPANCAQSDGIANLSAANTINPTYLWSNAATTEDLQGVPSGTYTVTVTNPNGACTATATATIANTGQGVSPTVAAPQGNALNCQRSSLSFTASGGNQYAWAGPSGFSANTAQINVTVSGTYTVTVTGTSGCSGTTTVAVVEDKTSPAVSATAGNITCLSPNAQLNASSITSGVTFQWAGPNAFSSNIPNPTTTVTGTYTVTATAPNGCTATATALVNGSSQLPTANATAVGPTTFCTGSTVTLNATTGTNYTYQWQRDGANIAGATNPTFTANVAGNYNVVVTDNGCSATSTAVVVNVLSLPTAAITTPTQGNTLNCKIASITLKASGGTQYNWAGPSTGSTDSLSVTIAGTYTVTVTDTNGCSATATVVISQDKNIPAIAAVGGALSCAQPSVQLNASSITPGVTFQWAGPNGFSSNIPNPTATVAGTYTATATAPNGCTNTATATVAGSSQLPTATITNTSPISICTGNSTTLNANINANYTYQWQRDGANIPGATNPTYTANAAGNYSVVATENGCSATSTAVVVNILPLPTAAIATPTQGNTLNCKIASITLKASGGAPYNWAGPGGATGSADSLSATLAGTYTVTVTGANGCSATTTAVVLEDKNKPNVSATGGALSCAQPSAQLNASSATPGATFQWVGPNGFSSNLPNPTATVTGTYTVTATAPNGCTNTASALVSGSSQLPTANATATGPTTFCAGNSVTLNATTGTNYTYQWQRDGANISGATNPTYTANAAGNYSVVATENGCSATSTAVVVNILPLPTAAIATPTQGNTLNCKIASITLKASGGTQYNWAGPSIGSTDSLSVTVAGTYTVTVRDANGCSATTTVVVSEDKTKPTISAAGGALSCAQSSVPLSASSTTPGTTFQWVGPNGFSSNIPNPTVAATGTYTATATAPNGCTNTTTADVTGSSQLPTATITNTNPISICTGNSVTLNATTGTNYTYQWQRDGTNISGATNPTYTANAAGNYSVVATENGCSATSTSIAVSTLPLPAAAITPPQNDTLNCKTASVALNASGGTQYAWKGPGGFMAATANISATIAGTYTVVVTGVNGCSATASALVAEDKTKPAITAVGGALSCAQPSVQLSATSTTPGVTFQWAGPNGFSSNISNPMVAVAGTYTATATAPNGCTTQQTVSVADNRQTPNIGTANSALACNPGATTTLSGTSQTAGAQFSWTGPKGFTSLLPNPTVGDTGTYVLTVRGPNGCTATATAQVRYNPGPTVSISAQSATCEAANGAVNLQVTNGTAVSFAWSNAASTQNLSNVPAGTYTATITGQDGCKSIGTATVSTTLKPVLGISSTAATRCTPPNGLVALSVSSVTGTPKYLWNTGQDTSVLANVGAGTYTVTVTAPNGCSATATAVVTGPNAPSAAISAPQGLATTCLKAIVPLEVPFVTGLTYRWNGPNGFTANTPQINVGTAGSYAVTVTNPSSNCTAVSGTVVTANTTPPTVSATGGTLNCKTASVALQATTNTTSATYIWTGPGGFSSPLPAPTVSVAGTYTVVVGNPQNGCTASTTAIVSENKTPPSAAIDTSGGTRITCSKTNLSLKAPTGPNFAYNWSGNLGSNNPVTVATAGTYSLTVTNNTNGCSATSSIQITADQTPPTPTVTAPNGTVLTCRLTPLPLNASGGDAYGWAGPSNFTATGPNPPVTRAGTYTVTVTRNSNGCTASTTITITADQTQPVPDVSTPNGITLNCLQTTVSLVAGDSNIYQWTGPTGVVTTDTFRVSTPGTYTVTVTANSNGCTGTASIQISRDVTPPDLDVQNCTLDCRTQSCQLQGMSAVSGASFAWAGPNGFSANGQTVSVTAKGNYTVTVTNPVNGCATTRTATVSEKTVHVAISGSSRFCKGSSTILSANGTFESYLWTPGNLTTDSIEVNRAGVYVLEVTDAEGCKGSTYLSVAQYPKPSVRLIAYDASGAVRNDDNICAQDSVIFAAYGDPGSTMRYQFFLNGQPAKPLSSLDVFSGRNWRDGDQISVIGEDANGCRDTTLAGESHPFAPIALRVHPKPDWTGAFLFLERNCPGDPVLLRLSCPNFPNGTYSLDYILSTNNAPGKTQVPIQVTNGNATLDLGILPLTGNTTCKIVAVRNDRGCETNPTVRNSVTFYNGVPVQSLEKTICLGETYNFYGRILQQAGRYTQLFKTYDKKCDSLTVELTLNVTEGPSRDVYAKFCPGTSFHLGDSTFTKAGNYTVYKNAPIGCDSVLNLVLNAITPTEKNTQATICEGESYPFNGQVFTKTGRYIQTIQTSNKKCDSLTLILDLTVLSAPSRNISATLCQDGKYILGDSMFNRPGKYTVFIKRKNSCDSVLNLTLIAAAAQVNLGKDTTLCLPATLTLNPKPQCPNCTYKWAPDLLGTVPSPTVSPTVATTYTVTVFDAQGCTATDAIRVQPLSAADTTVLLAKTDRVTLGKGETSLEIEVLDNDKFPTNFKLSLASPQDWKGNAEFDGEVLQYTAPSTAFLGTDTVRYRLCPPVGSACSEDCSEGLVLITVKNHISNILGSDLPNVITPEEEDGFNDCFDPYSILKFKMPNLEKKDCTLSIINRWGELIYLTKAPDYQPWGGTRGDSKELVPQGTYYYMFRFGDTEPLRGPIQVLRGKK